MITTLTLNPAIDRTLELEHLTCGQVNPVRRSFEDMGGKGINVARVLHALGEPVLATGLIGRDNRSQVDRLLVSERIPYDFVEVPGITRTNIKIVDLLGQNTTDLNEPGFPVGHVLADQMLQTVLRHARKSHWVILSGSLPPGLPADFYGRITHAIRQQVPECRVVLDTQGPALSGLQAGPFLFKPNRDELLQIMGTPKANHAEMIAACTHMIHKWSIQYVLLSLGSDGCSLISGNDIIQAKALPVRAFSTVGAGDALLAGFIHGLEQAEGDQSALRLAVASAAAAVSQQGRRLFDRQNILEWSRQVILAER